MKNSIAVAAQAFDVWVSASPNDARTPMQKRVIEPIFANHQVGRSIVGSIPIYVVHLCTNWKVMAKRLFRYCNVLALGIREMYVPVRAKGSPVSELLVPVSTLGLVLAEPSAEPSCGSFPWKYRLRPAMLTDHKMCNHACNSKLKERR